MRCCRTITGIISARNSRRSDGQIPPPPRKSWAISRRREGGCEDRAKGNRVLFLGWDLEEEEESGVEEEEEKKNDDDDDDDDDDDGGGEERKEERRRTDCVLRFRS